jgi:hypothetical protein
MDLRTAIKLAVRFAERKAKSPTIRQYVRFLPKAGDDHPARLCAQNAHCGVIVFLECDVPNTLVSAEFLEKVVKEAKFTIEVTMAAYGGVEFKSGPATWWVKAEEVPQLEWYPEVPTVPLEFLAIDDPALSRVVHAASKDEDRPALRTLHFGDGYVEATDKARFARASISGQWRGLLPVELFQKLPKGGMRACFTLRLAYLRFEDEIRFAPYVALPFPDCKALIPEVHQGFEAVASVESLTRAAKQALAISDTGSVTLKFEKARMVVSTWRQDEEPKLFETVVGAYGTGEGQILVDGKNLVAALKVMGTPGVRLWYNQPMDPLRLESAGYVEVLWPMLA